VLLLPGAGGWSLPCWVHEARRGRTGRERDDPFWPAAVQREVRRSLGLESLVLHAALLDSRDPITGDRHTVIVLEIRGDGWTPPPGTRWVRHYDLAHLSLTEPWCVGVLKRWFAETEGTNETGGSGPKPTIDLPTRPPWQRPGWYATATDWIEAHLQRHGMFASGPVEHLGTKLGRCLLRVPTAAGAAYFKALPGMYSREPRLLTLLAAMHPNQVPPVLAADLDRHWLLTRDHGGEPIESIPDLPTWENALRAFAELQLMWTDAADWPEALLGAGCPDLRQAGLIERTIALLADREALLLDEEVGLSDAEVREVHALIPRLRAASETLRKYGVPDGLVHGDFLPGNVAVTARGPVFLDWCETSLSHPFFSAVRFLASAQWDGLPVREQPNVEARLRDAYLEPWSPYGSIDRLGQAFALAQPLQSLHHALTYQHLWRLLAAETSAAHTWERRGVAARSLKRLLSQRDALPPG
jgi:hypothetical protein